MSRPTRFALAALIAASLGCSNSGGGSSGGGSTVGASTATNAPIGSSSGGSTTPTPTGSTGTSGVAGGVTTVPTTGGVTGTGTAGTGTTGAGTTTTTTSGGTVTRAQTNGPSITITSPARASFATQSGTMVQGTVSDPAGVAVLTVNGVPVAPGAGGAFSAPITYTPGINIIDVEATNTLNQQSKVALSVLYGQFAPDTQPIKDAMAVRLNQSTFDALSSIISSKLTGAQLTALLMARNPLFTKTISLLGLTLTSAQVDCTNASFGNPTVLLTPQQGDLAIHVEIPMVDVEVNAHDVPGSGIIPYSITGHVTADRAIFDAQVAVQVAPGGVVTTSVINDTISFQNFNWGINGFPSLLTGLATSLVQSTIQSQITSMVKTVVPQQVNQMLAGATGQPITQTIMGTTASIKLIPTAINFDTLGASLLTDADIAIAAVTSQVPTAPGSFATFGPAPQNGGPSPGFYASINEDFMNRAGYAVWKSGVARIQIDGSATSPFQLPAWLPLDMGLLQLFIPELVGKAPASDPIVLVVTPQLPPVFQAQPAPGLLEAAMGELALDIWDMAPPTPKLVLSFALHAKVDASATINAQNTFQIQVGARPTVDASLAASPLASNVNTIGLDNFITFVMPPLIQIVGSTWSGFPLPLYQGVGVANVVIYQDGPKGTFITAKGDIH